MQKQHKILDLILNKWWLRHALFWVFFEFMFGMGMYRGGPVRDHIIRIIEFLPGFMMVVYPLLYFLIPKLLIKKRFLLFILGYSITLAAGIQYANLMELNFASYDGFSGVSWRKGKNALPFVNVSGLAATVKLIRFAFLQENRAIQAKKQKTIAELELLKAQIHPHFLFNTLNNLFAHTLKKSSASSTIVLKLSDLLRFMVYESKDKFISLSDEINLINNYIDLEQLRYGTELNILRRVGGDLDGKLIIPLLLLPIIENAFKHGTSLQLDKKWINLDINVEGNNLHFILANSRDPDMRSPSVKGKRKGVGIHNVQRRLELLYPDRHTLTVSEYADRFVVNIDLKLDIDTRVKTNMTVENFQTS
jgi:hypothetical protein